VTCRRRRSARRAPTRRSGAKVAHDVENLFKTTKDEVKTILDGLDGKVDRAFDAGEKQAREAFERLVKSRMDAYKDERYSGLTGAGQWVIDKVMGMPPEVNQFFEEGKRVYLARMDAVISNVADIVGAELNAAKLRIARGRQEIGAYIAQLPADLRQVGLDAQEKVSADLDALESDVKDKEAAVVQTLAQKYVESRDAVDKRIDEMKAANKGLVDKAIDAVKSVVETIKKLKDLLLGVLAKAAAVIDTIIKEPIKFLKNLIAAIKGGFESFASNILEHLKDGIFGWLFGALGEAGIQAPKTFDLRGILDLVLQVLGLTWSAIRAKVVKKVGEPVMSKLEKTVDVFKTLVSEGPVGLWHLMTDKLSGIKDTFLEEIKGWVVTRIIKSAVTKLASMFTPVGPSSRPRWRSTNTVMFFIERASQLGEFIGTIVDSVSAIAGGAIGGAVSMIEKSLGKALPLVISFLARLIGLGGIGEKIKEVVGKIRSPVEKALDFVIDKAIGAGRKLVGFAGKGIDFAKKKGKQAQDWGAKKAGQAKEKVKAAGAFVGQKLGLIKVQQGFAMADGETHAVTVLAAEDGMVEVLMASAMAGRIHPKLQAARTDVDKWAVKQKTVAGVTYKKADVLKRLDTALGHADATALQAEWTKIRNKKRRAGVADSDGAMTAAQNKFRKLSETRLAQITMELSQVPGLGSLKETQLKERYLPTDFDGRGGLYTRGKSWQKIQKSVVTRDVADRLKKIDAIAGDKAAKARLMRTWSNLGWIPKPIHSAEYETPETLAGWKTSQLKLWIGALQYDVDHIHSLAQHWNATGWNAPDSVRQNAAYDENGLKAIFFRANRSKGSGGERFSHPCGPNFASEYAEGGMPNARSIDGKPFRDKAGKALT